ncbi:MAG: hypothetical protein ACE5LS_07695 [Thermoplasmata archaeon]
MVFEFDSGGTADFQGGVSDFQFEVRPDAPYASPRPYFTIYYGSGASAIPYEGGTWMVDVEKVG